MNRTTRNNTMLTSLLTAFVLALGMNIATGETIQIPVGQQGQDKQSVARPRTGMSQAQVKDSYGNPVEWTSPVGDPPISKWIYKDFIVVFEYDHVIHSVLVHTPQPTQNTEDETPSDDDGEALNVLSRSNN